MNRRSFLGTASIFFTGNVLSKTNFSFPRDHGSHPGFKTEWWYVTGWLNGEIGFQVTFFRIRHEPEKRNPSAFAPRQILLAHAAIADPKRGRLLHEERAARAGLGLAEAEISRTGVWIDDWRLVEEGDRYEVRIPGRELDFDLQLIASRKIVLQGQGGLSRKGHRPGETSHYYSRTHINVVGKVNGKDAEGRAWLDHEWSNAYMAPEASGWDWCGINLANGDSLMAFRMRARNGGVHYADPGVAFEPLRTWRSPRTGIDYPVSMRVENGNASYILKPLMDDQEFDARASTGIVYWEGAVRAFDPRGNEVGQGYLELTGYGKPMKL